mmetsp:Transcript_5726/g.12053  ORF Transcript_5726/g.12053 Transcript_5726/m.12053 type:complete len:225 (+) Transcript_5726:635-1309(+)
MRVSSTSVGRVRAADVRRRFVEPRHKRRPRRRVFSYNRRARLAHRGQRCGRNVPHESNGRLCDPSTRGMAHGCFCNHLFNVDAQRAPSTPSSKVKRRRTPRERKKLEKGIRLESSRPFFLVTLNDEAAHVLDISCDRVKRSFEPSRGFQEPFGLETSVPRLAQQTNGFDETVHQIGSRGVWQALALCRMFLEKKQPESQSNTKILSHQLQLLHIDLLRPSAIPA